MTIKVSDELGRRKNEHSEMFSKELEMYEEWNSLKLQ